MAEVMFMMSWQMLSFMILYQKLCVCDVVAEVKFISRDRCHIYEIMSDVMFMMF
ncbi:hypothetical protein [Lachnoclostridium sp.]|uniref:hypothetical protein n=1 Tax=Lachnoclostridium sp. TaxID=2028282 RepID=UPI002899B5EC|nr:hypothetical protein [Lachnoclostridium sp.]